MILRNCKRKLTGVRWQAWNDMSLLKFSQISKKPKFALGTVSKLCGLTGKWDIVGRGTKGVLKKIKGDKGPIVD